MYKPTMKKMSDTQLKRVKSSLSWGLICGESRNPERDEASLNRIDRELRSRDARAEHKRLMDAACIDYELVI